MEWPISDDGIGVIEAKDYFVCNSSPGSEVIVVVYHDVERIAETGNDGRAQS